MRHLLGPAFAALLLPTVLAGSPSTVVDHSPLTTSVSAHGLRISVSIANRAYTIGSPVSATVRLSSVSRHAVLLYGYPAACAAGGLNPMVVAVKQNGEILVPPSIPTAQCPAPLLHTLASGHTLTQTVRFELSRPWMVGRVLIVVSPSTGIDTPISIRTPILRVRTRGNAVVPPCVVDEGYPAGGCYDPPNVLSVPAHSLAGVGIFRALPAAYHAWKSGSLVVKAAIENPVINDQVPETAYGQLRVQGKPRVGARMTATWHYRGGLKTCTTSADRYGIASCSEAPLAFKARDLDRITVAVAFSYGGHRYAVDTWYRASND